MTNPVINIERSCQRWKNAFPAMDRKIEKAALAAFTKAKKPPSFKKKKLEINVLLANDRQMKKINHQFRGKNKATNVLSFPQTTDLRKAEGCLGDIILAGETVRRECKAENKKIEHHTVHLIVHGVLHLLGYDHMRIKDAKTMEKLECDILKTLGYPDPYHDSPSQKGKI
jgi:probable rRNA maturation factor